jgi:uncharacterized protein (DUF58 family)
VTRFGWRTPINIPFVPTKRLALLVLASAPVWLVASVPGLTGGTWVIAGLLLAIAVAVAGDAAFTPTRRELDVAREFPGSVGVGDDATGTYVLTSRWPARVAGDLYDELPEGVARLDAPPRPFEIAPAGSVPVAVRFQGRARGEWPLGVVVLRVRGRLGLMERTLRYPGEERIVVAPSLGNVRRYRLLAVQRRLRDLGVRSLRRRGEGTNFAGYHEYVPGDDPRSIDWKATARRRTMITREFSIEQGQTVMLLIDAGRLMTQIAGAYPRFEYALSSALSLADIAIESGDQVGALVFNDVVRAYVPPARGRSALGAVRSALLPVRATMAEPDYAAAFRTLDQRHRRRALVVVFTDVIDVRASQSVIAHTVRSARRHLPVVVALRNEALVEAASLVGVTSSGEVYERAAAEELLSARDEALLRMRQAGVSVLDVRPQAMTAAVINRYLELKGRGAV